MSADAQLRKARKFYAVMEGGKIVYWETSKLRAIARARTESAKKRDFPAVVRVVLRKFRCNLNTETFCLIYNDELDPVEEVPVWSNLKEKA